MNTSPRIRRASIAALAGFCALAVSGCAPSTVLGVRELGKEKEYTFSVPENYQATYRKIIDQERSCYLPVGNALNGTFSVQGDIYHDIRSGTITTLQQAGYGVNIWHVIDVLAIDENNTKVTFHAGIGPPEQGGLIRKEWVLENSTSCGLKGRPVR